MLRPRPPAIYSVYRDGSFSVGFFFAAVKPSAEVSTPRLASINPQAGSACFQCR